MKGFLTTVAVLLSFALTTVTVLALVLVVAGPHSDLLPKWLQTVVIVLGWIAVVAVPVWIGRFTWRRLSHRVAGEARVR